MPLVAPSLLAADFLRLDKAVELINNNADIYHLDVMDGTLVPNISFGFSVIEALAPVAKKPLDVHLMIVHPEKYIERFAKLGAGYISFHLEACDRDGQDPITLLKFIRAFGAKAGLAINPDMPVERVYPLLDYVDFVLVMSVFAGFGGQKFIEETYSRVEAIRAEATKRGLNVDIEVDGGVNVNNAPLLAKSGVTMLVAGSAVFKAENPAEIVSALRGE